MQTIKELFIDELHDILSAEEQIVKALPKVIEAAEAKELKDAFRSHLQETKEQIKRLGKVFKLLKEKRKPKFCKGTKGLIDECNEVIKTYKKSPVRDAGLISKAQRIEHYEISAYGTLCTFAKELGHADIAKILHVTLNEEEGADKKLTKIAEGNFFSSGINHEANLAKPAKKTQKKGSGFSEIIKKIGLKTSASKKSSKKSTAKSSLAKKTAKKSSASKGSSAKRVTGKSSPSKISHAKKTVVRGSSKGSSAKKTNRNGSTSKIATARTAVKKVFKKIAPKKTVSKSRAKKTK